MLFSETGVCLKIGALVVPKICGLALNSAGSVRRDGFALLHLASMRMMKTLVPTGLAGTAQSIYAFCAGGSLRANDHETSESEEFSLGA
jgi:hypothetical protein